MYTLINKSSLLGWKVHLSRKLLKTKTVYKNINIFTVCRPFPASSWTVKSIYRLLSKQWQRGIKNTSCDSILPYFPGNEHFCWLLFFAIHSLCKCSEKPLSTFPEFIKEWKVWKDIHIFSYIHSHIHLAHLCWATTAQKASCTFMKQHFLWSFVATFWRTEERKQELGKHSCYFSSAFKDAAIRVPKFLSALCDFSFQMP